MWPLTGALSWGGGGGGGALTGKNLEGSGEEEASAFLQSEELAEEQEERQAAEDDGEDHESLDRLDPLCGGRGGGEPSIPDMSSLDHGTMCFLGMCNGAITMKARYLVPKSPPPSQLPPHSRTYG